MGSKSSCRSPESLSVCLSADECPAPIQLLRADPTPVRSIAWQPHQRWWCTGQTSQAEAAALADSSSRLAGASNGSSNSSSSHGDGSSTHYFLTVSSIGNLKVWDTQDVLQPCHERIVSRNSINCCLWLGPPHVWITASADGVLRQIWLDAGVQATNTTTWTADGEGSGVALKRRQRLDLTPAASKLYCTAL